MFAAFVRGWSASPPPGGIDDQDDYIATSIAGANTGKDDDLFPITVYANEWADQVWPIINNVFESGLGARNTVSRSAFVRYTAMTLDCYMSVCEVLYLNYMTFHFQWNQVFPFSDTTPASLYKANNVANNSSQWSDVDIAQRLGPVMQRLETLPMFPRLVMEAKRIHSPIMAVDLHARVEWPSYGLHRDREATPTHWWESAAYYQNVVTRAENLLDYIETTLFRELAVIKNFLPYPMSISKPWELFSGGMFDIAKYEGMFNSGLKDNATFGDTGDPVPSNTLRWEQNGWVDRWWDKVTSYDYEPYYFSRFDQPPWGSVRLATWYALFDQAVDNRYILATVHKWKSAAVLADDGSFTRVDAGDTYSNYPFRWLAPFINSRFKGSEARDGVNKPGFLSSQIGPSSINRNIRLQAEWDFSLKALLALNNVLMGQSLRSVRPELQRIAMERS
jgi:hypothetical protein